MIVPPEKMLFFYIKSEQFLLTYHLLNIQLTELIVKGCGGFYRNKICFFIY